MADFDIGRQARLDIVANGAVLVTQQLTGFHAKQETITIKSRPLNGPPVQKEIPDGWTFDYMIDRLGPQFDNFFAGEEENYWDGVAQAQVFITQTIQEKDGSISQFRFEGISQKFDDAGNYEQDKKVEQKVSGFASRRRVVI